jgi:hypothetical protein
MILFWVELTILVAGFVAAVLLFWRIPTFPRAKANPSVEISVVTPARNEAKTLPLLLSDFSAFSGIIAHASGRYISGAITIR